MNTRILVILFLSTIFPISSHAQWVRTNGPQEENVHALSLIDTILFAGTDSGVFITTDNGTNWVPAGLKDNRVEAFAVIGTNLFAGTSDSGVFVTTNNAASWKLTDNSSTNFLSLAVIGTNIFGGTDGGDVFRSTDSGRNWSAENNGPSGVILALIVSGTTLFAGSQYGVFRSIDSGTNWIAVNTGLPANTQIISLDTQGTNIFAGTYGEGVFFTTDSGANWTTSSSEFTPPFVSAFAVIGTSVFAGDKEGSVFLSTDTGEDWADDGGWPYPYPIVTSFAVIDTTLFAGTYSGVWRRPLSDFNQSSVVENTTTSSATAISVFPNPASGTLQILGGQSGEVYLFDLMGRERMNAITDGGNTTLDVSRLEPGMYFLREGNESAKVEIVR